MKIRVLCLTVVTALMAAGVVHSGDRAPTIYNTYDGFEPGARAIAMGGAFCSISDDPSGIYHNPAGLSDITQGLVSITYEPTRQSELTTDQVFAQESLQGRSIQYLAFITQKGAFSWRPLANSVKLVQNGLDWSKNEVVVNAYTISTSHTAENGIATGLNLTFLSGSIAQSKVVSAIPYTNISDGYGFTMDLGFMYKPAPQIRMGLNLRNLAGYMWWDDFEKDQLPFVMRAGVDFQIQKFTNFAMEWENRYYRIANEQNITHFGIEQWLGSILALRAGISGTDLNDKESSTFSAGVGYTDKGMELSLTAEKYRVDLTDVVRYVMSINIPI